MPWYVFKCSRCGSVTDIMLPVEHRDTASVSCHNPKCALRRMDRQPTAANFTVAGFAAKNGYAK